MDNIYQNTILKCQFCLENCILNISATDIHPEFNLTCTCKKAEKEMRNKVHNTSSKFNLIEITTEFHN